MREALGPAALPTSSPRGHWGHRLPQEHGWARFAECSGLWLLQAHLQGADLEKGGEGAGWGWRGGPSSRRKELWWGGAAAKPGRPAPGAPWSRGGATCALFTSPSGLQMSPSAQTGSPALSQASGTCRMPDGHRNQELELLGA